MLFLLLNLLLIFQLRDSFRELKRRFGNTKFNYSKRNDRSRNPKAVRNQQQQVAMYEEKLQVCPTSPHLVLTWSSPVPHLIFTWSLSGLHLVHDTSSPFDSTGATEASAGRDSPSGVKSLQWGCGPGDRGRCQRAAATDGRFCLEH